MVKDKAMLMTSDRSRINAGTGSTIMTMTPVRPTAGINSVARARVEVGTALDIKILILRRAVQ